MKRLPPDKKKPEKPPSSKRGHPSVQTDISGLGEYAFKKGIKPKKKRKTSPSAPPPSPVGVSAIPPSLLERDVNTRNARKLVQFDTRWVTLMTFVGEALSDKEKQRANSFLNAIIYRYTPEGLIRVGSLREGLCKTLEKEIEKDNYVYSEKGIELSEGNKVITVPLIIIGVTNANQLNLARQREAVLEQSKNQPSDPVKYRD